MSLPLVAVVCLGLALFQALAHLVAGLTGLVSVRIAAIRRISAALSLSGLGVGGLALIGAMIGVLSGQPISAFGFQLDGTGAALLAMVSLVGGAVLRFSRNYLDGDPRHAAFLGGLHLTLATVIAFVLAASLWTFALAWVAMSLTLHRLLVFYPDRPVARLAAFKKFVLARLSDAALLSAFVLLYRIAGSADIAAINADIHASGAQGSVGLAAVLLVVAAVLKSAQFPAHGWLVEVMETPTPVSALLHAGVVNAGGVLLLRFSDVVTANPAALWLLAIVALASIIVGSLVMMTQTSVKAALAWSTIAQMGFMLLQCALGAFGAALFHILAHAVYKANAFLTSGTLRQAKPAASSRPFAQVLLLAIAIAVGASVGIGHLSASMLVTVLAAMGVLIQLDLRQPVTAVAVLIAMLMLAFAGHVVADTLRPWGAAPIPPGLAILAVADMALLCAVQVAARLAPRRPVLAALYVHLRNGLYINTWLNKHSA